MNSDKTPENLVSIVIPAFNSSRWIRRAIDSTLRQSWPNIEVIVLDDGSTDSTGMVCRTYGDRIRYIRQNHGGVSAARNRGVSLAGGVTVGFLDADDELLPDMIRLLMKTLGGLS